MLCLCTHDDNYRLRSFKKKLAFKRWNSATRYVKFHDHRQRFFRLVLPPPPPPPPPTHTKKWNHIFDNLNFQTFPGIMPPDADPPRLTCPFRRRLSWFIGHLCKLLIRTPIRYRDNTDQETASWRLHCTVRIQETLIVSWRISLLRRIVLWCDL